MWWSIALLWDSAIAKKESNYVLFVDLDTLQPTLLFLYLKELTSQGADDIVKVIKSAFSIQDLRHLLQNLVFIASDGGSKNTSLKGEVAGKFRDEQGIF